MYWYIRVQTVLYAFKKVTNRSRTHDLLHTSCRNYPFAGSRIATGFRSERRNINSVGLYVYIHCHCNTAGLCTWCLVTKRRCRSRSAAAPGHDIPRQSLDLDHPKAQMCILATLRGCYVPADRSPIEKEAVT